jgi:hypothetical protein
MKMIMNICPCGHSRKLVKIRLRIEELNRAIYLLDDSETFVFARAILEKEKRNQMTKYHEWEYRHDEWMLEFNQNHPADKD